MGRQEICYLCGQVIESKALLENDRRTRDHNPPAVFFPKTLRKGGAFKNLETLATHQKCNNELNESEEYVGRIMALFVGDQTKIGKALLDEFVEHKKKEPQKSSLPSLIMDSASEKLPSGIYAPPDKLAVPVDALKMQNVMWKIARGIYFKHFEKVLPEGRDFKIQYYPPPTAVIPPQLENLMKTTPTLKTSNPSVFIYKYGLHKVLDIDVHSMIFLFWDCFIVHVMFHALGCQCGNCNNLNT